MNFFLPSIGVGMTRSQMNSRFHCRILSDDPDTQGETVSEILDLRFIVWGHLRRTIYNAKHARIVNRFLPLLDRKSVV